MGVASGCGEQEVSVASGSGWNLWVLLLGVYGCKEVYRFPHTTYPYSSCIYLFFFTAASLLFVHLKKKIILLPVLFAITFYVLNNFFMQYKHTYGQLQVSHGSHMKAAHVLCMKKHRQMYASYPSTGQKPEFPVLHKYRLCVRHSTFGCPFI